MEGRDDSAADAAIEDELADLLAAITFFTETNGLDWVRMRPRANAKAEKFREWQRLGQ